MLQKIESISPSFLRPPFTADENFFGRCLKNRIRAQGQGGTRFQPADILAYFEELKRGPNAELEIEEIFEITSINKIRADKPPVEEPPNEPRVPPVKEPGKTPEAPPDPNKPPMEEPWNDPPQPPIEEPPPKDPNETPQQPPPKRLRP